MNDRRWVLGLVVAVGCGGTPRVTPPAPLGNAAPAPVVADVPAIDVTTLSTAAALAAVPRAARLQATAQLRWHPTPMTEANMAGDGAGMTADVWPVLDATPTDVRIAIDGDDAVIAAWLARGDLAPTIVEPVTPTKGGAALPVTLRPGTAITVEADGTTIALEHEAITLQATVPGAAVGDVFTRGPAPPFVANGWIDGDVDIRATPDASAPVFARLHEVLNVQLGETRGAMRAFTYADAYVSLRGYVPAVATSDQMGGFGFGGGRGPGGSHVEKLQVPARACLLAPDGAGVVGITTTARERLVRAGDTPRYWAMLLAAPWGTAQPLLEDLDATGAVATARVRTCDGGQ